MAVVIGVKDALTSPHRQVTHPRRGWWALKDSLDAAWAGERGGKLAAAKNFLISSNWRRACASVRRTGPTDVWPSPCPREGAMHVRRLVASVAATAVVAGLSIVATAPAASAATQDLSVDCTESVSLGSPQVVSIARGDTLSVTSWTTPCDFAATNIEDYPTTFSSFTGGQAGVAAPEPLTWTVRPTADFGLTSAIICFGVGTCTYYVAFDIVGPSASSDPIPAWVQSYGRFGADATCEDGWSASWQAWAQEVTGGWVCTRSIPSLG